MVEERTLRDRIAGVLVGVAVLVGVPAAFVIMYHTHP